MERKEHWEHIYATKAPHGVSWFQEHAERSIRLIRETGLLHSASIIDVGGGASTLVDDLIRGGYSNVTVLDLSAAAIAAAKKRLGAQADQVAWVEADVTEVSLPVHGYDLWHDRAVFHFLTSQQERSAYVSAVLRSVRPGGHVIVATFSEAGPTQCSGLPVMRYSAGTLHAEFGDPFVLLRHEKEKHRTPTGNVQEFVYCYCRMNED